jgi:CRP-like cAMP-binding protein/NAD-dependent dihydropyrimidine dehydrogenase PreA subunit
MGQHESHLDIITQRTREQERRLAQQRAAQATNLQALDCLHEVAEEELKQLVDMCNFRAFLPGEVIISERKASEFFFILLQGSVALLLHNREGNQVLLEALGRGDCFGEGPLFSGFVPRTSARAESACYTLQLPLVDMRSLLYHRPGLGEILHRMYLRRLVESKLASVPIFNEVSAMDRLSLAAQLQPVSYARDHYITQQGKAGRALYIIDSGQVVVEQDGTAIALLGEGDFFGEIALVYDQPHTASIRALTPTNILALPASSSQELFERYPEVAQKLRLIIQQRQAENVPRLHNREYLHRLKLALKYGLIRGTHLLVRTPALCPVDCTLCETACANRHGSKRLRLNGVTIGNHDIPDACRQCRFGAECFEVCPENAIEWNDRHILVITDACTGCGDCIPACPYGVIRQIPRTPQVEKRPKLHKLGEKTRKVLNNILPTTAEKPVLYTHRADKCDLCQGYEDMACISQCPTGAMRLLPVEEVLGLQGVLERGEKTRK